MRKWQSIGSRLSLFEPQMNEGRRSQVVLLDERRLDILIQPKLYACDLLDIVASHFCLREKEYFGLAYLDETGHYHWLQLDKRVLEHDLPRKTTQGLLVLHFLVKYYVESISLLKDSATVEAFYLQCKSLVGKGTIEADSSTVFHLAALVLQATYGNYEDDQTTKNHLKKLPVLPTSVLKEHPSIAYCENKVIEKYKEVAGNSRGSAIVSYMNIVETLPTYGIHFYEVKDKGGIPWWIGLSYKGISQYDYNDRKVPRKFFQWKLLENLYFRDKKFSIEVHNPRRVVHTLSSFNVYEDVIEEPPEVCDPLADAISDATTQVSVSRRTFGPGNVTVLVWFAATPCLTKCIWSMAIAQHQFHIDNKADRKRIEDSSNLEKIAAELSKSSQSLSSSSTGSNLSRSASSHSLPTIKIEGNQNEETEAAREEMMLVLKARKEALEEALAKKVEELRALCLKEGELIGEVPPEIPLNPGENMPQVRRRVGTSFLLNDQLISKAKTQEEVLSKLELEYELQNKIASAALRLASDMSADRSLRRQRKVTYQNAYEKLRQMKEKLGTVKKQVEESKKSSIEEQVIDEQCDDNVSRSTVGSDIVFHDSNTASDVSPAISPKPQNDIAPTSFPTPTISVSAPPSPCKHRTTNGPSVAAASNYGPGYAPSTVYQTATTYRRQQYPTLPVSTSGFESTNNTSLLRSPYKNRFESGLSIEGSNLYSVQTQRTSQAFDSQDDILAAPPPEPQDLGLICRHNSLESNRRHYRRHRASPATVTHTRNSEPASTSPSWSQPPSPMSTAAPINVSHAEISRSASLEASHAGLPNVEKPRGLESASRTNRLGVDIDFVQPPPPHFHQQYCTASPGLVRRAVPPSTSYPEGLLMCSQEPPQQHIHIARKASLSKAHSDGHVALRAGDHPVSFFVGSSEMHPKFGSHEGLPHRVSSHGSFRHERRKPNSVGSDTSINTQDSMNDVSLPKMTDVPPLVISPVGHGGSSYGNQLLNMCLSSSRLLPPQCSDTSSTKSRAKDWVETSLDSPLPARKTPTVPESSPGYCSPVAENMPAVIERVHSPPQCFSEKLASRPSSQQSVVMMDAPCSPPPLVALQRPVTSAVEVNVVTIGHFQPYWEETKPYEMSDFYKYSTKHRKPSGSDGHDAVDSARKESTIADGSSGSKNVRERHVELSRTASANAAQSLMSSPETQQPPSLDGNMGPDRSSVSDAFQEETIAWYEDQDSATLV
ncbi:FERM domain-containing protein 4B-like isoform X2 [Ornithodoros turicata]|uniref:FERM domain-containing protein 4B-like isoform X2 n=1 Tax=Ornithodoros turicata TaxID=34597 RepID=UPI00313A3590